MTHTVVDHICLESRTLTRYYMVAAQILWLNNEKGR